MISTAARPRWGLPSLLLAATSLAAAGCRQSPKPVATRQNDASGTGANVPVATQHNDVRRTGAYLTERVLTPDNVKGSGMRLRARRSLDGNSTSQPLYIPHVTINGRQHNVVYLLTVSNSVYAYDADDRDKLWPTQGPLWVTRLPSIKDATRPNALHSWTQGTPVIDVPTQTMYLVYGVDNGAWPNQGLGDGAYDAAFHIAALDIRTGKVLRDSVVHAEVPSEASPGVVAFAPQRQVQRPGLLLTPNLGVRGPKSVYIAFATRYLEEAVNYHGWAQDPLRRTSWCRLRIAGWPGCLVLSAGGSLEAKEQRARPAAAGDEARHLGERAVTLAPEQHAVLQYNHLMTDALPFAQQPAAGRQLGTGSNLYLLPRVDLRDGAG